MFLQQKLMEHLKNHGKMKPKVARKKTKPASVHLLRAVCGAAAETALMQEMKKAGADARLVVSTSVFNNARCFDDKWEAKQQVTCENDVASVFVSQLTIAVMSAGSRSGRPSSSARAAPPVWPSRASRRSLSSSSVTGRGWPAA